MANVLASNTLSVLPLLSGAIEDGLLRWLRAAELTCDRAALLVAQDHRVVISSLMKLAGGSPKLNAELNVEAFLRQVGQPNAELDVKVSGVRHVQHRDRKYPLVACVLKLHDNKEGIIYTILLVYLIYISLGKIQDFTVWTGQH